MTQLSFALRVMSDRVNRGLAATMGDRIGMRPVVGYPKSGGTWLCGLLSAASGLPFAQLSRLPVVAPAVVQGHWRYSERFGGVAYIVRDGRDVMVSFYYHCRMQYHDRPSPTLRAWIRSLYGPRPDFSDTRANLPRFIEEMMRRPLGSKLSWPGSATNGPIARGWSTPGTRTWRVIHSPRSEESVRTSDFPPTPRPCGDPWR